ncbi:MAG: hypothetical protein P8183_18390, partial [Anaerolineae bacterium]
MKKILTLFVISILATLIISGCGSSLPELPTRTPEANPPDPLADLDVNNQDNQAANPSPAPAESAPADPSPADPAPMPAGISAAGGAAKAVDLIGAWVEAGAPETDSFDYTGYDGNTHQGTFEIDIQPLFTTNGLWFEGSQACIGCHFANSEASYHEMNLSSYEGIMTGADALSEPPGVPILGQSEVG